jgi:hypothetical protein
MKNIFSLIFGLWSITLFSQTPDIISQGAGAITGTSAFFSARAYAPIGAPLRAVLQFGTSSGSLTSSDSSNWNGQGANPINISFSKNGLGLSTTYYFRWLLKNNSGIILDSTIIESFGTLASNPVATVQILSAQPLFNSLKVISKINNGNQAGTFILFYKHNNGTPTYTNTAGKYFNASYGDQYDTTVITGLTNVQYILYGDYVPTSGYTASSIPVYGTPAAGTRPTVYSTPTVNYRYDTMQIVTQTNQTAGGNDSVKVDGFDSTNTLIFTRKMRVNDQLTTGVFVNYFNGISYPVGKLFTIRQTVWNTTGRDSVTTAQYRMLIAPAVTQTITNSSIKAKSAWFDVKLTNNDYFCLTRHTFRYRKNGVTDWEYGDTMNYSANNSVRRISLNNLDFSSSYEFILTTINCSGAINEYSYPFTTKAPTLPPTITKPSADGGCGFVRLNSFGIIPRTGDTSYVEVRVAIEPDVVPTTLVTAFETDDILNYPGVTYPVPAGKMATFFIIAASKDDSATYQVASNRAKYLDRPTAGRSEVSKTDSTITVSVFGGRGCGNVIKVKAVVREYNSWAIVKTIDDLTAQNVTGTDQYIIPTIVIGPDLKPSTKYYIEFAISNEDGKNPEYSKGLEITTLPKSSSGISMSIDEDIWEKNPEVVVRDLTSRVIARGFYKEVLQVAPKNQVLSFSIEDKKGKVLTQKQIKIE